MRTKQPGEKNRKATVGPFAAAIALLLVAAVFGGLRTHSAWAEYLHSSAALEGTSRYWGGTWGVQGGKYGQFTCQTCHQPGTTGNIKQLQQNFVLANLSSWSSPLSGSTTPPWGRKVSYLNNTSLGSRTEAGRRNSVRVCEVCHTQTKFHRYSTNGQAGVGNHYQGAANPCITCHKHEEGFMASCNLCHGNPPVDATIGTSTGLADPPTGATSPGAHSAHTAMGMKCGACHSNHIMPARDNHLHIQFRITNVNYPVFYAGAGSPPFGSFSGAVLAAPWAGYSTGATKYGVRSSGYSCSNYCHGNWAGRGGAYPNPIWENPASGQCGGCHFSTAAAVPSGAPGSHTKHVSSANYAIKCTVCHSSVSNRQQHVQGRVAISFDNLTSPLIGTSPAPTYRGSDALQPNAAYSVSLAGLSANYGQCGNLYCHGNGQGISAVGTSPTWGVVSGCNVCHNDAAGAGSVSALSGAHGKHVNNATVVGKNFVCVDCHGRTVNASNAIASTTYHVNAYVDYSGARAGRLATTTTWSAGPTCAANVYCHTSGKPGLSIGGVTLTPTIPAWNQSWTPGQECKGCHGLASGAGVTATNVGEPNYPSQGVGVFGSNSHTKHSQAAVDTSVCSRCHNSTVDNAGKLTAGSLHVNRFVNFSSTKFRTYNASTRTCSNFVNGCHTGAANPVWGSATTCNTCHPIASLSGAHAKHLGSVPNYVPTSYRNMTAIRSTVTDYGYGCSNCHPMSPVNHAMGSPLIELNPSVTGAGSLKKKNAAYITTVAVVGTGGATTGVTGAAGATRCFGVYCHSNGGSATGSVTFRAYTTPAWNATFTSQDKCSMCHGNSPNSTGSFGYRVGSAAHYNSTFFNASSGGHGVGIHYEDIATGSTGLMATGNTNTSSHGNAATSTTINCYICHFATVTVAYNDKNVLCQKCHNGTKATLRGTVAIADKRNHVNGAINVTFNPIQIVSKAQHEPYSNYTTAFTRNGYKTAGAYDLAKNALDTATMWNSSTKTCSNVACHMNRPVSWTTTQKAWNCTMCHKQF